MGSVRDEDTSVVPCVHRWFLGLGGGFKLQGHVLVAATGRVLSERCRLGFS